MEEILEWLSDILSTKDKRKALLQLKGSHAQSLIDFLNSLLWDPDFSELAEPWLRKYTLVTLRRLCESSMLYPQSYVLTGIENPSHEDGGGFCDIYRGSFKGKVLCLKVVRLFQKSDKDAMLKACAREAILWCQLDHPNIVPFYGIFYLDEAQHRICLVSPWMENGNIKAYLKSNPQAPRKPFIYDIASGLEYLHTENIVHGDLKGLNVLVTESQRACLADFGLSTIITSNTLGFTNTTAAVSGRTNRWASPELLEDNSRPTRQSDIWAFGCVCYEVLTRLLPFQECSSDFHIFFQLMKGNLPARPGAVRLDPVDEVDEGMWKLMNGCWSTEAEMRPTCRDILQEIESDVLIQRPRDAHSKDLTQERRQLEYTMRKSSSTPVDMDQIRQILEEVHKSQSESPAALQDVDPLTSPEKRRSPTTSPPLSPPSLDYLPVDSNEHSPDDPDTAAVPPRLGGGDWSVFSDSKAKGQLNVTLVHTLMHESVVCCVRFSADGKWLATGCKRTTHIYDAKTGQKTCMLVDEAAGTDDLYIRSVCFSPDGRLLVTGAEDSKIRIWDIAKKCIRNVFDEHQQGVYSLNFSRDGRFVVSGSGDQTARIWDMADGTSKVLTINDHDSLNNEATVTSVAISPNGQYVATGNLDDMVRIWDVQTGQLVERLRGHRDSVYSVAFTPDGKGLVSGSLDKTLKFWDVSALGDGPGAIAKRNIDGKKQDEGSPCTMNFTGHNDYVLSVAISSDGKWVVSGSKDRGVLFWNAKNATVECMLQGHTNSVISVDLSPIGSLLATGSGDWRARIWSYSSV